MSARFVGLFGQLRLSMDVGKLEGSRCGALGIILSSLGAQHCIGGAVTRFTCVITPRHVSITRLDTSTGVMVASTRSIAHCHRDLDAWRAIAMVKSCFH